MGYHHTPYNVQGMTRSSLDSPISDAVQAFNLGTLAMIARGLHVHTRTSQLLKLATIQRSIARCQPAGRVPARHSPLMLMEQGKTGNVSKSQ
jgi:hypothetical protein